MLRRWIVLIGMCLAAETAAHADVLHFGGTFQTLYDCPHTWPGSACGSPTPVSVSIPFTFSVEITQIIEHNRVDVDHWVAPDFPLPPPITQATFESLSDRSVALLSSVNTYQGGPVPVLLSYGSIGKAWTGIDALGRTHTNQEFISFGFEGTDPRAAPGTPIAFHELQALWGAYFAAGRKVNVQAYVAHAITPPGSFEPIEASGHWMDGTFRLCRAPGGAATAAAAVMAWLRRGG